MRDNTRKALFGHFRKYYGNACGCHYLAMRDSGVSSMDAYRRTRIGSRPIRKPFSVGDFVATLSDSQCMRLYAKLYARVRGPYGADLRTIGLEYGDKMRDVMGYLIARIGK